MKRYALPIAAGLALTLTAPSMARPAAQAANWRFQTVEGGLADGTATSAEGIFHRVKNDKNKSDKNKSGKRPPGWNKGNKTGWGGRNLPPGQAKKQDRDRDDRDYRDNRGGRADRDRNNNGIPDSQERDRDRDGTPDYRDNWVDVNRNGVDDRQERRNNGGGYNANVLTGVVVDTTDFTNRRIAVRLSDGRTLRFDIARNIPIVRGGRTISVHDIRNGDRVQMRVTPNGRNAYRVNAITVY